MPESGGFQEAAMMITFRLVRLIESHSEALASGLLYKVQNSTFTKAYEKVPPDELKERVYGIYQHLGDWLLGKKEVDVERRYRAIGSRRYHQNVPLNELVWAIVLTRENLWEFLTWESGLDRPIEVFAELELLHLVGQFFDRAIFYAAAGYEDARLAKHPALTSVAGSL
ncbi:MAG TPA: hypothetical protein VG028_11910 [Terriglobia bacterium]|nr:hypothetical protein [Terriglobia bacterium]